MDSFPKFMRCKAETSKGQCRWEVDFAQTNGEFACLYHVCESLLDGTVGGYCAAMVDGEVRCKNSCTNARASSNKILDQRFCHDHQGIMPRQCKGSRYTGARCRMKEREKNENEELRKKWYCHHHFGQAEEPEHDDAEGTGDAMATSGEELTSTERKAFQDAIELIQTMLPRVLELRNDE